MNSPSDTVRADRKGHTVILTLSRPEKLNALNREMQAALKTLLLDADKDPDVWCIIITGEGRAFCSGADVGALKEGSAPDADPEDTPYPTFTTKQLGIFKPTICAVNGVCAGAGLHFVADSDIVIASESASFVDTHVNVGQVTALEPIGLIRKMAPSAVLRMVLLGKAERLTADQALVTGLASEVVPADRLMDRALALADAIAQGSPAAVEASMKAIWESLELPLSEAHQNGFRILMDHRKHPDSLEGTTAFMEKRKPIWTTTRKS